MNTMPANIAIKHATTASCHQCGAIASHPRHWVFRFKRDPISALSGEVEWNPVLYCEPCSQVAGIKSNLKEILGKGG